MIFVRKLTFFAVVATALLMTVDVASPRTVDCTSDSNCQHNLLYKHCCMMPGDSAGRCGRHTCKYAPVDNVNTVEGLILGFQDGANKHLSTRYSCMQPYLPTSWVNTRLQNAYRYGAQGGYYEPSQQLMSLGHQIGTAATHCKTEWQKIFHDLEEIADAFIKISQMICQYKEAIMVGDEVVPEAAPIIDGLVEAACAITEADDYYNDFKNVYDCGKGIIDQIQRHRACSQQVSDTEQYVQAFRYNANMKTLGEYGGKLYLANQECKPVTGTAQSCWNAAQPAIKKALGGDDEDEKSELIAIPQSQVRVSAPSSPIYPIEIQSTKRMLQESGEVINQPDCPFCLTEGHFISFFEGYYLGQAKLNVNISEANAAEEVQKCLDSNDANLVSAFTGGLQANLTKLMLSYQQFDLNQTKDAMIGLSQFIQSVFKKDAAGYCSELQHSDDVNLPEAIRVNGTQLQFLNTHDRLVDMTATPQLIATIYQNFTLMQAKGQLTTTSQQLSHIGLQLGLNNMLLARTGTAHLQKGGLNSTQIALISVGSAAFLALVAVLGFLFYKKRSAAVNKDDAECEPQDCNEDKLVVNINDESNIAVREDQ